MKNAEKEKLRELLKPWAGIWTWHTSHALDEERFNEVVENIHSEFGGDIPRSDFKEALAAVVSETPPTLDGSQPESVIDRFTDKAIGLLGYLEQTSESS
ncbi:MAG: hypothetical protein AB2777_02820 [Candidatus Thiodiazotropha endolucinida]